MADSRALRRLAFLLWLLAALCMLAGAFARGQVGGPPPAPVVAQGHVPRAHLYYAFLMVVNHNDYVAAENEKQGHDGAWLRNLKQRELGFTDEEFAPLRATAQRLEAELKEIDDHRQAINDARQAAYPLPPKLQALRQQHDAEIEKEADDLKRALGPAAAAKLDLYIQKHFQIGHPDAATVEDRQSDSLRRYNWFLASVNRNLRASAEGAQGRGGSDTQVITDYQSQLGFTDEEFALVRAAAQRLEAENKKALAKEKPLIDAYRATLPPSLELRDLSQQREATLETEVSNLQDALGPDLSARLDRYLHGGFRPGESPADLDSDGTRVFQMETSRPKK